MKINFFDLDDLDCQENFRHCINSGVLSPEPVLPLGPAGAFDSHSAYTMSTGVLREPDGRFRMWYWGMAEPSNTPDLMGENTIHIGYAESSDGVVWEKPVLNLVEYRGSKRNNLVRIDGRFCPGAMNVVRDDEEPNPDYRYKAIVSHHEGAVRLFSKDGLDWRAYNGGRHVYKADPYSEFCNFTTEPYCLFKDPLSEPACRWKSYGQASSGPLWGWQRRLFYAASPDAITWSLYPLPLLGNPLGRPLPGVHCGQVHGVSALRLGRVIPFFCHYGFDHPETGWLALDIRLAVSRDGVKVADHFDRNPLVALPAPDHWGGGGITCAGPVVTDDEIFLYCAGLKKENCWAGGDGVVDSGVRLGLVRWPRDGVCCLEAAGDRPALLLTHSLPVPADKPLVVQIAADISPNDLTRLELFDGRTLKPIGTLNFSTDVASVASGPCYHTYQFKSLKSFGVPCIKLRLETSGRCRLYHITF